MFDTAAVAEIDVISEMADKHCYSAADSNVSKRRSAHSSSRDHLDKEPAVPGEQVGVVFLRERKLKQQRLPPRVMQQLSF